jgi:Domain of unknown function (DUF4282)
VAGNLFAKFARLTDVRLGRSTLRRPSTFSSKGDTLTDQGFGQSQPDDASRGAYGPSGQGQHGAGPEQGTGYPTAGYPAQGAGYPGPSGTGSPQSSQQFSDAKGFIASLFDFGFTSFVTPKVVKVLYVLIMIVLGLGALVYTLFAFKLNAVFGIFVLIIGDPLFLIISLALYRISLELFVVIFRIAEDLRAIRDRGGFR